MIKKILKLVGELGIFIILFLLTLLISFSYYKSLFSTALDKNSKEEKTILIEKGSNLKTVSVLLEKEGIIKSWRSVYYLYSLSSKLQDKSEELVIIPGEYNFSPSNTPVQILSKLNKHEVLARQITIPEGKNANEIGKILISAGLITTEDFIKTVNDISLIIKLGIPGDKFEGYLFPLTYSFTKPITASEIFSIMVKEGNKKIETEIPSFVERSTELGLDPYQVITLASIIEKETGVAEERAVISSVFHNRLKIDMPLQTDPTVIYGIKNFNGNLTKEDLKTATPYNTYLKTGLPPTPIANPGIDAIKAALYPEKTEYLYFVAKGDGSHQFSKNYRDHQLAVNKYQKKNNN